MSTKELSFTDFMVNLLAEGYGYRVPEENPDTCHCGEAAQRTCPCGKRVCHEHLYDAEGERAGNRDGFCGECLDLIRTYEAK